MANAVTYYQDPTLKAAREAEVTAADFDSGANKAASCACGVGIATDVPNLTGDPSGWTLLDQAGASRVEQDSQHLGETPTNILVTDNAADHNNTVSLVTLAAGWVQNVVA